MLDLCRFFLEGCLIQEFPRCVETVRSHDSHSSITFHHMPPYFVTCPISSIPTMIASIRGLTESTWAMVFSELKDRLRRLKEGSRMWVFGCCKSTKLRVRVRLLTGFQINQTTNYWPLVDSCNTIHRHNAKIMNT